MRFLLTLWISKLVAFLVNIIDKKRGSNYSGKIALKLMPDFVRHFQNIDYDKVIFISGTNGKSTTTNLLFHTLKSAGKSVAANTEGANMMGGVATTLIKNSTLKGSFQKEYLVLEIDERSFPLIRKVLPGRHMGITNLQKDQVQRNGDPDFILRKFQGSIGKDMHLYLNNEEPRSQSLEDYAGTCSYFQVIKNSRSYEKNDPFDVTLPCPKCAYPIHYEHYNLANIGPFHCTHCAYGSKETADVQITSVDFENGTFQCGCTQWQIPYSNPFYIYNFAMCIAICRQLGLHDDMIKKGFQSFQNPASHEIHLEYNGKHICYLQGKQENPEALQSELDIIAADPRKKAVYVGMYRVSDFAPHYAGSFYFFDCDFTPIVKANTIHYVAFSETVANDIASRMILAGAGPNAVYVRDTNTVEDIFSDIADLDVDVVYILTNTTHAQQIKNHFLKGGAVHAKD